MRAKINQQKKEKKTTEAAVENYVHYRQNNSYLGKK